MAQDFLSPKQKTESVTEITRMFHERALFCLEHVSTEQARVSRYFKHLEERYSGVHGEIVLSEIS